MEQWSILSNVVNYTQHDRHPRNFQSLNVSVVNKEKCKRNLKIKEEERDVIELDFGDTTEKLKENIKTCMKVYNQKY